MKLEHYSPSKLHIDNLLRHCELNTTRIETDDGERWIPARPFSGPTMRTRLAAAWDVFTGKADALYWRGQ